MKKLSGFVNNNVTFLITAGLMSMLVLVSLLNFSQTVSSRYSSVNTSASLKPTPVFTKVSAPSVPNPLSDNPSNLSESEPNDYYQTAPSFSIGMPYTGKANDFRDYYAYNVVGRGTLTARLTGLDGQATQLVIYDTSLAYPANVLAVDSSPPYVAIAPITRTGIYHVLVYTVASPPTETQYSLTVSFSPDPTSTPTRTPTPSTLVVSCANPVVTPAGNINPGGTIEYTMLYRPQTYPPYVQYQVLPGSALPTPTPGMWINVSTNACTSPTPGAGGTYTKKCTFAPLGAISGKQLVVVTNLSNGANPATICAWQGTFSGATPPPGSTCTNVCEKVVRVN